MEESSQSNLYLGLFLIVFALYATQLKKRVVPVAVKTPVFEVEEKTAPHTRIEVLFESFTQHKLISQSDGVMLIPKAFPIKNDFVIALYGDDIYADADSTIHDSWQSLLDDLAVKIKNEPGLKVEISGFADADKPAEKKITELGSSSYAFSYARAEFLAHYFERKHGIDIQKKLLLRGMGPVAKGKKVELRFYY